MAALAMCGRVGSAQQDGPVRVDSSTGAGISPGGATSRNPLAQRIAVMLLDATLRDALTTIGAQAGVRLTYSSDNLTGTRRVSFASHDVSVGTALQIILDQTGLHAVAMPDGSIVITPDAGPPPAQPTTTTPPDTKARSVMGRVARPDGSPVQGATLGLTGIGDALTTGPDGRFAIPNVPAGRYVLWARRMGFRPARVAVTIAERDAAVAVTLVPVITQLPSVTTTSPREGYRRIGFDVRMRSGSGQFLTYDQIEAFHAETLTALLQRLRGIHVAGGQPGIREPDAAAPPPSRNADPGIRLPSNCTAIVIDGVAQGVVQSNELDMLIQPLDVGAIEAYPTSELPGSFGPETGHTQQPVMIVGDRDLVPPECGLVLIWTRQRLGMESP